MIAHTETPVVLVRAGEQATDEHVMDPSGIPSAATAFRPVVVGVDSDSPDDSVLDFAFEEARRRGTALHVVSGWQLPPYYPYVLAAGAAPEEGAVRRKASDLTRVLLPWRQKYPGVEVVEVSRSGSPARHLVDVSHDASLLVVGRRVRHNPFERTSAPSPTR